MASHLNDEGFLKRFRKRLDARAQQELSARVQQYRSEGLLGPKPVAMTAKIEFDHFVEQLMESGLSRSDAVKRVVQQYPRLQQAMIAESNRARSRR
jgi:hypothetical protein